MPNPQIPKMGMFEVEQFCFLLYAVDVMLLLLPPPLLLLLLFCLRHVLVCKPHQKNQLKFPGAPY